MDTKLKMSVIMAAVDKITAPIKKVTNSTAKLTESMKSTKAELDKISHQQKDIEHFKSLKKSIKQLKPELQQQQELVEKLSAEYNQATKPTKKMAASLRQAENRLSELKGSLRENRTELKNVVGRLDEAGIKTNQLASHTRRLGQQTEKYNNSLERTKNKLKEITAHEARYKAAQDKRAKSMQMASNMAVTGAAVTYTSQRTIEGIKSPLNAAADFEAQMSKVQAISKATEQQLSHLSGQSRQLGAETVFSASEVASAQEYLAVAGFDTQKILAATPDTLKLAQAGNLDLARAADIASDSLTAFNMGADEMGRMADVLALTSTTSNTNVNMLGDSLKTSAGVAGSFGGTIEQVSAMLGIMANSGIKASQAGTAISSMYSRIASPPKEGQLALEQLGVNAFDAEGKMRALPDILQDIADATNGMADTDTAPLFKAIFGAEAGIMAGSKALLQAANNNRLGEYVKELENAQGTAGTVASQMTDNLRGTVKGWDSAMESLKISAGTALIPTVRELTVWVTGLTRKIDKFAQENPNLVKWLGILAITFAAVTAVIGPLMLMISTVIGSYATLTFALSAASAANARFNIISTLSSGIMKGVAAAQWLFNTALSAGTAAVARYNLVTRLSSVAMKGMAAAQWLVNAALMANPIGLVILAVAALVAIGAAFVDDWGAVGQWFLDLWEGIKTGVGKAVDFIKAYINALLHPIDSLKSAFSTIADWFSGDDEKNVNIKRQVQTVEDAVPDVAGTSQRVNRIVEAVPGVAGTSQRVNRTVDAVPDVAGTSQRVNRTVEAVPGVAGTSQLVNRTVDAVPDVAGTSQRVNRTVDAVPDIAGTSQRVNRTVDAVPDIAGTSQRVNRTVDAVPDVAGTSQRVNRTVEAVSGVAGTSQLVNRTVDAVPDVAGTSQRVNRTVEAVPDLDAATQKINRVADVVPLVPDQVQNIKRQVDESSINKSVLAAALTASVAALPAAAVTNQVQGIEPANQVQVVPANPLTRNESKSFHFEGDKIEIVINPLPGMDERAIADLVVRTLEEYQSDKERRLRGMLND